jgi:hypothetical protein
MEAIGIMFTQPHKDSPLVAIVGCSAIKSPTPTPARDFYRSPLFKAALAYAEARTKHVAIVSAMHGAVKLDQILTPYDRKLTELRKSEREDWGVRTVNGLIRWCHLTPLSPPPTFLLLCGDVYSEALVHGAHWYNLPRPDMPLAKMKGVGNRIAWLNRQRADLETIK